MLVWIRAKTIVSCSQILPLASERKLRLRNLFKNDIANNSTTRTGNRPHWLMPAPFMVFFPFHIIDVQASIHYKQTEYSLEDLDLGLLAS